MELWLQLYLLAFIVLSVLLLTLVLRHPLGVHNTFSQHAAQSKKLSIYYTLAFCFTMPLMTVSLYILGPSYAGPFLFLLATVAQIACTFIPEKGSKKQVFAHRLLAGISAGLLAACLATLSIHAAAITWIALGIMATCVAAGFVMHGRYALILQSIFYLVFIASTGTILASTL